MPINFDKVSKHIHLCKQIDNLMLFYISISDKNLITGRHSGFFSIFEMIIIIITVNNNFTTLLSIVEVFMK